MTIGERNAHGCLGTQSELPVTSAAEKAAYGASGPNGAAGPNSGDVATKAVTTAGSHDAGDEQVPECAVILIGIVAGEAPMSPVGQAAVCTAARVTE